MDLAEKYWAHVVMLDGTDACWEWTGLKINGRPYMSAPPIEGSARWRLIRVSRWLWERMRGPIKPKHYVLHSCDNPGCVNLIHFFVGTQTDNMRDMRSKGRSLSGERNPHSKLTAADVGELRNLRHQGIRLRDLAERYGITESAASAIARGKSWKHL